MNYSKSKILSKNERKETFKVKTKVIKEKNWLKDVIMNDVEDEKLTYEKTYIVDKRAEK